MYVCTRYPDLTADQPLVSLSYQMYIWRGMILPGFLGLTFRVSIALLSTMRRHATTASVDTDVGTLGGQQTNRSAQCIVQKRSRTPYTLVSAPDHR